jgi:hypothetical protein
MVIDGKSFPSTQAESPSFNLLQGFGDGASAIVLGSGAFKAGK